MEINQELLTDILYNCYRKYKSYLFYSNNLEFAKMKIAEFENDSSLFKSSLDHLSEALINEDSKYFIELIKKTKIFVAPKTISKPPLEKNVEQNYDDESEIRMEKVNFFISLPAELYIIDTLWSILFGFVKYSNNEDHHCYANTLSPDLFIYSNSDNILEHINFNSLSLFEMYFKQYTKWSKDAVAEAKYIRNPINNASDVSLFSIDLSRYFYTVNIDFEKLTNNIENINKDFKNFRFLTTILELVYKKYSNMLRKYDKTIDLNQIILPIGLVSSCLLANYNLEEFDKAISEKKDVVFYYGRYVDDILIVTNSIKYKNLADFIEEHFSDLFRKEGNTFYLKGFCKENIQTEKTKLFKISKDGSQALLDRLDKEIRPSEPRLFPSYQIDMKEFLNDISSKKDTIKVREASSSTLNTEKLVSAINGYLFLNKNTKQYKTINGKDEIKEAVGKNEMDAFLELLTPATLLANSSRWNKIFLFASMHKNGKEMVNNIQKSIEKGLEKLIPSLKDSDNFNSDLIYKSLIKSYKYLLKIALASSQAITGIKHTKSLQTIDKYSLLLRNANLIDSNAISIPLVNYSKNLNSKTNFYSLIDKRETLRKILENELDLQKIALSPRYIHLSELMYYEQLKSIQSEKNDFEIEKIIRFYDENIANLFGAGKAQVEVSIPKVSGHSLYKRIDFRTLGKMDASFKQKDIYIGLANIKSNDKINPDKPEIHLERLVDHAQKRKLIKLLNDCYIETFPVYHYLEFSNDTITIKEKVKKTKKAISFLVFPELFLPIYWVPMIIKYANNTGTAVVTGIKYIKVGKRIINLQLVVIPYQDKRHHRESLVFFREKNNYAPFEKEAIKTNKAGLEFYDHEHPVYYKFNHLGINFTSFICYELTDIYARALMRHETDIIFASEYNLDISYFSSITESASRDLSAFVTQVNYSNCGDTKIVAPYRDKFKIIASINGGEKDSVHIGHVDIEELRNYLSAFKSHSLDCKYSELKSNPDFKKNKKPSAGF